jgi:hypothetical protein
VVNPHNGPGGFSVPDRNYTAEIPKLTAYPNVRVLGYVHTTYANRDISAVLRDVDTYAAWSQNASHPGLGVEGIFFDECPSDYDAKLVQYLENLAKAVKNAAGLGPDNYVCYRILFRSHLLLHRHKRSSSPCLTEPPTITLDFSSLFPGCHAFPHADLSSQLPVHVAAQTTLSANYTTSAPSRADLTRYQIIHNPGAIPDQRYMSSADCTVVFEETYATFTSDSDDANNAKALKAIHDPRSDLCLVMHSIPPTLKRGDFRTLVDDVRKVAGSIFMTDLDTDYYADFSGRWREFVDDMALG